MRAVVVGAGLGGLCVAHGLHKALERSASYRAQELSLPGTSACRKAISHPHGGQCQIGEQ
jgi:glycine/D-amino acid oxidase-like deaminating enzyme